MAVIIKPDNSVTGVYPVGDKFTLQEFYKHLECDTVQIINMLGGFRLIVDENAKLRSEGSDLTNINSVATLLAKVFAAIRQDDYILGPVFLCYHDEIK